MRLAIGFDAGTERWVVTKNGNAIVEILLRTPGNPDSTREQQTAKRQGEDYIRKAAKKWGPAGVPDRLKPIFGGHGPSGFQAYAEAGAVQGYEASREADGTWTIHDVPVFSVHTDERRGEPEHYDEDWLYRAVKLAQGRERHDGYLGPLHKQHHPSPGVEFAGKFRLTGVRDLLYEGTPTPTIYADFVGIPDEVYQEIKGGRFPYRSVEIPGPDKPEVLSIALLDHEVPYFRYANMRIARERKAPGRKHSQDLVECVTYDLDQDTRSVTFNYDAQHGDPMRTYEADEDKKDEDETEKKKATKKFGASDLIGQIMELLQQLAGAMDGGDDMAEAEAPPVSASLQAPAEQHAAQEQQRPVPHAVEAPVEQAQASAQNGALVAEVAALKAQLRSLQASQQAQAQESEAERAERAFADAGANEAEIEDYRKLAKEHGAAAAAMFARNMEPVLRQRRSAEPPRTFAGDLTRPLLPAEVLAYQDKGPEIYAEAQAHYAAWNAGSKRHSLSTYLAAQLDEGSFFVNGKN